jgi:hypothetical protein
MGKLIRINEITQDELATLKRIDEDCHRMHTLAPPKVFLDLNVFNPDGEHVLEYKRLSKTWVRNAYNILATNLMGIASTTGGTTFGAGKMPCKDTGGTARHDADYNFRSFINSGGVSVSYYATAGTVTRGIIVGTGTGAESFEDYVIGTLVAHGTGSGQMSYQAQAAASGAYDAGTRVFTTVHRRSFDNSSGGTINVSETALYYTLCTVSGGFNFLMSRDLLAAPVAVANGQRLTVDYTFTLTYPA